MASSDANDDNVAVVLGPLAKMAKNSQRNSVVTKKEVVLSCKRKAVAPIVPRKKNRKIIESDDNDDDENFIPSCEKALKRNPLDI